MLDQHWSHFRLMITRTSNHDVKLLFVYQCACRSCSIGNLLKHPGWSAMGTLFKLEVTNAHFNCEDNWNVQSDGLAIGAPLDVILSNNWTKSFEASMQKPNQ